MKNDTVENRMIAEADGLLEKFVVENPPVAVDLLAEFLGIRIVYKPYEDGDDVSGMLYRGEGRPIIGVNSAHHIHRQRFTIAHEIGHFVLHDGKMYVDTPTVRFRDSISGLAIDNEEIEANGFAAELLLPRKFLEKSLEGLFQKKIRDRKVIVEKLSSEYKVSAQTVEFRLKNLGVLLPE